MTSENKHQSRSPESKQTWDTWWQSRDLKKQIIEFVKDKYFDSYFAGLPIRLGPAMNENDIIIELGSGQSKALPIIKSKVSCTTIGFDLSREVAKTAYRNADAFIRGDFFHLPLKDKSVDVCYNQGVLEHFAEDEILEIFSEIQRVCRKKVVFCVPAITSFFKYVYNPFDELDGRFMSKKDLLPLMEPYFKNTKYRYLIGSGLLSLAVWGEIRK